MTMGWRRWAIVGALLAILIGAAAARLVDLGTNPGGLFPDEAAEALSGRQILRDPAYRPLFISGDGGREALYAYTVAAGFAVAGDSVLTLRTVAALWGVLGVLGIWLLARRFGEGVGLAAAAWAAGSLWLIVISREGMRNTITPAFCALALAALLAFKDRPTRGMAIVAGATMAVATLYTYQALKLLPLLVLIWLLWLRRIDREGLRRLVRQGPAFLGAFVIVGAPMILVAVANPSAYLGRAIGVSVFNPALPETDFATHVLRTLGMFAFVGDPNPRHDVASLPLLTWPLVVLALLGLLVLWRRRTDAGHSLILLCLAVMLLPPLLSTEGGSPHFLRALGLAAPLAVAIGLGARELAVALSAALVRWAPRVARRPGAAPLIAAGAIGVVLVTLGIGSAATYLQRPAADRYAAFSNDIVAVAGLANAPADVVILDDFDALTVRFLRDESLPRFLKPGEALAANGVGRVFARSQRELQAALGDGAAASAQPVAWDPLGQPTVWAVVLG
jgi:hypothetical protein